MAGNTYAAPSASRDATLNSKVSVGSGKSLGAGHNQGQKNGGSGQIGSTTAGMTGKSLGAGYGKGQNAGCSNGKSSGAFSKGGVINGKV